MNGQGQQIPKKHYVYLALWGGSLFLACTPAVGWVLGLSFLVIFFLVTTFKIMKKLILVFLATLIVGGFLINILGKIAAVILIVLPIVSIFLKINFLRKHWKALRIGFYAYFGYIAIMAIDGIFGAALPIIGMLIGAAIFTNFFHDLLIDIYQEGYDTDKAFAIVGLTPIIVLSIILPFLKIDVFGMTVFDGIAPDNADIDIHKDISLATKSIDTLIPEADVKLAMKAAVKLANLPDSDINVNVKLGDLIKLSGFDIGQIVNVPVLSHALEASLATSAAYGVFKVERYEKECAVRNEDGTVLIISPVDEVHSIIKNQDGQQIGDIYFDSANGVETVKLSNGFIYSIIQSTGYVLDYEGNFLGRIAEGVKGSRIFRDKDGNIVRKFKADGSILDGNDIEIGCAAV